MNNETYFTDDLHSLKKYWEDKDRAIRFLDGGTRTSALQVLVKRVELDIHQGSWLDTGTGSGFVQTLIDTTVVPTLFIGLDFSGIMLRTQQSPYGERVMGSTFQLPFRRNSFNIVTNIFSLSDYPEIKIAFIELGRVVDTAGSLVHLDYAIGDDYWERRKQNHNNLADDGSIIVGNINLRSLEQIKKWSPEDMRIVFQKYLESIVKTASISALFELPKEITRKFILTQFYKYRSKK
ncbi:MAG: Demethylmenaquinone methyltransferase [Candidatus Heimdallarchaeota archaeon LC_2]|nr:MAG: Demethylmenaquinone methyltransferase [Candidatus Heimdallarchaeota archaeon LC_2]